MASEYSSLLRLELISPGEQAGLWGNTTNTNLGTLLEQAIAGVTTVTLSSTADYTLTTTNGTPDEARSAVLVIGGTPGGATNIIVPSLQKWYIIKNGTPSTLTIKTSGQTGAPTITAGCSNFFYCDGTNVAYGVQGLPVASGGTGGTDASSARTALGVPSLTGTGASGTWAINVTGSAGSASSVTNGVYTTDLSTSGGANKVPKLDANGNMSLGGSATDYGNYHRAIDFGRTSLSASPSAATIGIGANVYVDDSGNKKAKNTDYCSWCEYSTTSVSFMGTSSVVTADQTASVSTRLFLGTTTGNMTIGGSLTQSSDARLKTALESIPNALAKVQRLNGYTFNWIENPAARREMGLVAQEVKEVAPEVVGEMDKLLTVSYPNLVALLVEAIKELNGKVDALQMRVSELTGR